VIEGLSTQRVLVEERAPGQSIGSVDAFAGWDTEKRRILGDGLLALMLRQMLSGEPFHADPHPGNVFLRPDGRLELIDFGAVGRLDPYERAAFLDLLRGVQGEDPTLIREGLLRIGTPGGPIDEEALDRELARLLSRGIRADGRINAGMFEDLLFVLRDFRIVLPSSTTTLLRTFVTLLGTTSFPQGIG
jgi:ubiquinone biosynthesis protein